jgi:hypothetical protein
LGGKKEKKKMGNERWKTTTTRGSAKGPFSNGIFVVEPASQQRERMGTQSFHGTYIDSTAGNTHTHKGSPYFSFPLYMCTLLLHHTYFFLSHSLSQFVVVVPYFETGNCCLEPTDTT